MKVRWIRKIWRSLWVMLFLTITGCGGKWGYFGSPVSSYAPSMHYTQETGGHWRIITPLRNLWERCQSKAYLPEYFSPDALWGNKHDPINFFYAECKGGVEEPFAVWIQFINAYYDTHRIDYITGGPNSWDSVVFKNNSVSCITNKNQIVVVNFSVADINFDSSSVYFLKDNNKISGQEKAGKWPWLEPVEASVYNLASEETLQVRQQFASVYLFEGGIKRHEQKQSNNQIKKQQTHSNSAIEYKLLARQASLPKLELFPFTSFYFYFPLTCADLEGAEFVIDGLSRHGKLLPPLRVRLNYFDFSKVPK